MFFPRTANIAQRNLRMVHTLLPIFSWAFYFPANLVCFFVPFVVKCNHKEISQRAKDHSCPCRIDPNGSLKIDSEFTADHSPFGDYHFHAYGLAPFAGHQEDQLPITFLGICLSISLCALRFSDDSRTKLFWRDQYLRHHHCRCRSRRSEIRLWFTRRPCRLGAKRSRLSPVFSGTGNDFGHLRSACHSVSRRHHDADTETLFRSFFQVDEGFRCRITCRIRQHLRR